jgi:hypothetical protein
MNAKYARRKYNLDIATTHFKNHVALRLKMAETDYTRSNGNMAVTDEWVGLLK